MFFFRVEHQLTNTKGITELECHYLANSIAITDSGKKYQYTLQLGESFVRNKVSLWPQLVSPQNSY